MPVDRTAGSTGTDRYTSKIVNPGFEQGLTGWDYKSMGVQGNDVFTLKAGSNYVEKWTGRGGAVGSASVSQQLLSLPPGNYELSAAAQNIQEDTPNAAQTGACIFADTAETKVTVRNTYKVTFDHVAGTVTIGFKAVNASGNWLATLRPRGSSRPMPSLRSTRRRTSTDVPMPVRSIRST